MVTNSASSAQLIKPARGIIGISAMMAALALISLMPAAPASAQIVERGVQGGVVGALIGGALGGGKGVGRGAAIGAGVGLATGAIERDQRNQYLNAPPPPPPPGPPPGYGTPNLVSKTQVSLLRLGYNTGPVDGAMGPATASAISDYQYRWHLPVTGTPSWPLLDHMRYHGG